MRLKILFCLWGIFVGLTVQANGRFCVALASTETPIERNPAYEFWASWIGGTWHIDTQSEDGQTFRARSLYTWGPGKRFVIVKTSVVDADGAELENYENILAAVDDHVVNYRFGSDGSVETLEERTVSEGTIESTWISQGSRLRKMARFIAPDKVAWELCAQKSDGQWRELIKGVWFRER